MILKQKQGFSKKEFELIDDTLKIKTKDSSKNEEWTIKIEQLGEDKYYQSTSKIGANIVAVCFLAFCLFVTIAFIVDGDKAQNIWVLLGVYALFGGIAMFLLLTPRKRELHLIGGNIQMTFFPDSPSKEKVDEFIDEIIRRSKKILIEKYGKIDPDLPEDTQMNQLNWLKNRNLISEKEYEQSKQEYKTRKLINGQ
ncbi:MAG: hypothetical protein ABFD10_00460 [Prolixibacteraceae bacterium]